MRRLIIGFCLAAMAAMMIPSCYEANKAAIAASGKSNHVKQFSGGAVVGEWDTIGIAITTRSTVYFKDKKTKRLVELMGDIQITVNE